MTEAHSIAIRLASSPWFPVGDGNAVRDGREVRVRHSQAYVAVEDDTLTITVTDPDGAKREYRAVVQLVATAPAAI